MITRHGRLLLFLPLLVVLVPFLLWPLVFGLLASFTDVAPGSTTVHWVGLANYIGVTSDSSFVASWKNIATFTATAVPAELLIGLLIAYLLLKPFRGRGLVRVLLLVPWLISPIASGVMWHFLLNLQVGLLDYVGAWLHIVAPSPLGDPVLALPTAIGTDVWRNAPLASFLLLPGMMAIPREQWEFATLEGASGWQQLIYIALPRMRLLLLTVALLLVGDTLGIFDSILILTGGGPGLATVTPALYSYQQAFQFNLWPSATTSAWLIVASVLIAGLVYLRLAGREVRA